MQFKYPEILYFLSFLLIPILVHLFQLQKFKKTPFTNVAFLQKLVLETRKNSRLKKWLILTTRLLLFTALVIAFSQPYFGDKKTEEKQHNFIYLDNSLSLNSKGEKGDLLKNAISEIIENSIPEDSYSLLTNSEFYENISSSELKNVLLKIRLEAKNYTIDEVLLKIKSQTKNKSNTLSNYFLISDFQSFKKNKTIDFTNVKSSISFIKRRLSKKSNLSIDSVFINNQNKNTFLIHVSIKNQGKEKSNIPIALYNNNAIISKQVFSIKENEEKTIVLPIQNQNTFNGKITLDFDDAFLFDNTFYFTLNSTKKINILSIGKNNHFLSKIYTKNEFNFSSKSLQNVNYSALQKQDLIVLNELTEIPQNLTTLLKKHLSKNGSLTIIPSSKINYNSYNSFFNSIKIGNIQSIQNDSLKITTINFKNPFFKNVFSKSVQNFQYPIVKKYYITNFIQNATLIDFENRKNFINKINVFNGNLYWISSALNIKNSNFTNSPLVVPVFYNFGKMSAKYPQTYYTIDRVNMIDIFTTLKKDEILTIKNSNTSFIPLQQSYPNKVTLQTLEQPKDNGFYTVNMSNKSLETIAFNYPKSESSLQFLNIKEQIKGRKNLSYSESITDVFQKNQEKNKVTWLWKWFLTLAIVSLLFEILILKFFKP